jgi:hypothetical protein
MDDNRILLHGYSFASVGFSLVKRRGPGMQSPNRQLDVTPSPEHERVSHHLRERDATANCCWQIPDTGRNGGQRVRLDGGWHFCRSNARRPPRAPGVAKRAERVHAVVVEPDVSRSRK